MSKPTSTGGVSLRQNLSHTFKIDYLSLMDDTRYKGEFTSKKLSIRDLSALGVRKAQLNGGMHHSSDKPGQGVDSQTDEFNNMLAHLELAIVAAPSWWDLEKIADMQLFLVVFQEVMTFENSFLGRVRDAQARAAELSGRSEDGGAGDSHAADDAGSTTAVVGKEVQSALEP
jgi:hypothetical protein